MTADMMKIAVALGICAAAYKFSSNNLVKGAAIAVGGVLVAKQLPYLSDALA